MKNKDDFVPRALRDVWEWKDAISLEVAHLPAEQALAEIMRKGEEAAIKFGFRSQRKESGDRMVAESRNGYGKQ